MSKGQSWYDHFKYSMNSIGLPAPEGVFGTFKYATANIGAILGSLKLLGAGATMAELLVSAKLAVAGAGSLVAAGEVLAAVVGVSAAAYVGACIGAAAYATGQYSADNWFDPIYDFFEAKDNTKALVAKGPQAGANIPAAIRSKIPNDMLVCTPDDFTRDITVPVNACFQKRGTMPIDVVGSPKAPSSMVCRP